MKQGHRFRAGIELHGYAMRYAEVELGARDAQGRSGAARLLRLGACDFEFDVADALLTLDGPTHLDTITTAVREIFDGSEAETLHVTIHPWNSTSFFSPLAEGMPPSERFEQLRQEAAMLSDASVTRPVRVKATPVRIETLPDGRRTHWNHVLRLPESVHAHLAHVARRIGPAGEGVHEFVDATGAVASVIGRMASDEQAADETPFTLALGVYDGHTEFTLCRGETWFFGHHAETRTAADGTYFGAALLDRLGVALGDIGRLYVYGDTDTGSVAGVEALLGREAEALNPLHAFHIAPSDSDPFALSAYAPVIGALLR